MLTTQQAADKWGVKRMTVIVWIGRGKIPGVKKFGNVWMIPPSAPKPKDGRRRNG